jgi:hypothetical protein
MGTGKQFAQFFETGFCVKMLIVGKSQYEFCRGNTAGGLFPASVF